jgi:hypothetical protein
VVSRLVAGAPHTSTTERARRWRSSHLNHRTTSVVEV